uniref:Uncharacterized protein n=1 Tax=Anguilla anguilla TaxID=7936 RepID=A0A0E9R937_ANGAN
MLLEKCCCKHTTQHFSQANVRIKDLHLLKLQRIVLP